MTDVNIGNLEPLNQDKFFEEFDSLEENARREKLLSVLKERNDVLDYNRQLYRRTKEAEGFEQNDKGEWVKIHDDKKGKKEPEPKAKEPKSDELGYGELAFLAAKGVKDEDVDFTKDEFKKFKSTNPEGKIEDLLTNPYFKSSLDARVAERDERNAVPEGGRPGQGNNDSFEIHMKRYRETGKMPQGQENAGLRVKLSRARLEAEKSQYAGPSQPIVGDYKPR